NAGGPVFRQSRVLASCPVKVLVVPRVSLIPEDIRDADVLRALGYALGTEQTGLPLVVSGEQTKRRVVARTHRHLGGGADVFLQLLKVFCRDDRRGQVRIGP